VRLRQVMELTAARKSPEELWSPTACSSVGTGHFFRWNKRTRLEAATHLVYCLG